MSSTQSADRNLTATRTAYPFDEKARQKSMALNAQFFSRMAVPVIDFSVRHPHNTSNTPSIHLIHIVDLRTEKSLHIPMHCRSYTIENIACKITTPIHTIFEYNFIMHWCKIAKMLV